MRARHVSHTTMLCIRRGLALAVALCASNAVAGPWLASDAIDAGEARIAFDLGGELRDESCRLLPRRSGAFHVLVRSSVASHSTGTFLERHRPDGSIDTGFAAGGVLHVVQGDAPVTPRCTTALAFGSDQVAFAGRVAQAGVDRLFVVDATGQLDAAFDATSFPGAVRAVTRLADGRFVVAYTSPQPNVVKLAAVMPDGLPDLGFGVAGTRTITTAESNLVVDLASVDATIYLLSRSVKAGGVASFFRIAAFSPDGESKSGWANSAVGMAEFGFNLGGAHHEPAALALSGATKIAAVGHAELVPFGETVPVVAVFDASGMPDAGFAGDGLLAFEFAGFGGDGHSAGALDAAYDLDGRLVVVGRHAASGFLSGDDSAVARFLPGGAFDPGFNGDGRFVRDVGLGTDDAASSVMLRSGTHPLVGGRVNAGVAALNYDGFLLSLAGPVLSEFDYDD